jgi:small-conductance mechanosensitive channel
MDYFDQVKQAELARLRTEYEQFILKKEQEMNHFKQQIVFLHEKNVAQEKEMEKNLQENKILKRAVTIQNQQKEECQQENIMLKSLAQQAAEHIKRLEQTNYALRVHLQTSTTSQIDHHTNSPPDVF